MRQVSYKPINAEYLAAIKEVVRISDRKHNAWDKVKEFIAKAERLQPQQVKNDCKFSSPTGSPIASRETDTVIMVRDADNEPMRPLESIASDKMTHPLAPDTQKLVEVIEYVENALFLYGSRAYYLPEHIELVLEAAKSTISQPEVAGGDEPMRDVVYYGVQNTKHHYIGKDKHGFYVFETSQWAGQPYSGYKENWKTELSLQMKVIPQPEAAKVALDDETADKLLTRHTVNDCIEALETALQTPASDGWMTIETAPPYTDILMMFMSEGKYQKCQVASYIVWKDERIYSDWKWAPLPTHWMPLTALKQSTAKDED